MGHGAISVYNGTIASAGTLSTVFDLYRGWQTVYLSVPSMTSNTQIHIQGASEASGSFRRVKHPSINSSTVSNNDFAIASNATNCLVPIPNGIRFLKVETTATVNNGCVFQVICSD